MLKVTSHDYNFYKLVTYINNPVCASDFIQTLQSFRSKLSLRWVEPLMKEDTVSCLSSVWFVLFKLAENDDPTIRISVFSTIGAFIFGLSPFVPYHLMKGFEIAIQNIKYTSQASISILSSFLHVANLISIADLDDFVSSCPVLPHFSVDVSVFIQHVPHLIPLMSKLSVSFHQAFLRSLLISLGRNPNHSFVDSIFRLILLNPNQLMNDFIEFVTSNSLFSTLLALAPFIINNGELYKLLNEDTITLITHNSLKILSTSSSTLTDVERACSYLSALYQNNDETSRESLKKLINESLSKSLFPPHFQKVLLVLPNDLVDLRYDPSDTNSVKCSKIKSIGLLLQRNHYNKNSGEIILALEEYSLLEGDVFTTFVNVLNQSLYFLKGINDIALSNIIDSVLNSERRTWVQDIAVIRLLVTIGLDYGSSLVPKFEEKCLNIVFRSSMSNHSELSKISTESIKHFSTHDNLDRILRIMISVDLLDIDSAIKCLNVLLSLIEEFDPKLFIRFQPIIVELLYFHRSFVLAGLCFRFLLETKYSNVPFDLQEICLDWIIRMYKSATQNDCIIPSPLKCEQLPYVITTIETDIVASVIPSCQSLLDPLIWTFLYYVFLYEDSQKAQIIQLLYYLCPIFPERIIPLISRLCKGDISLEMDSMIKKVYDVFSSASSLTIVSSCCEFFSQYNCQYIDNVVQRVESILKNTKILSPSILYSFYSFLISKSRDFNNRLIDCSLDIMDEFEAQLFLYKASKISPSELYSFLISKPLNSWPFHEQFFQSIFDENDSVFDIILTDEMGDSCLKFILNRRNRFSIKNIDHFFAKNSYKQKRFINIDNNQAYSHKIISQVLSDERDFITEYKIPSEFCILSFFSHSTIRLTDSLFHQYVNFVIKSNVTNMQLILSIIDYSIKHNIHLEVNDLHSLLKTKNSKIYEKLLPVFKSMYGDLFSDISNDSYQLSYLSDHSISYSDLMVSLKPNYYLENFIGYIKPKKSIISTLITCTKRFLFSSDLIKKCIKELFDQKLEFSSKSLILFVRLVRFTVINYSFEQLEFVLNYLIENINSFSPAVLREISYLLNDISLNESRIVMQFETFEKNISRYPLFSPFLAYSYNLYGLGQRISKGSLIDQINSDIPSVNLSALRSLQRLISPPYKMHSWSSFVDCLPSFTLTIMQNMNKPCYGNVYKLILEKTISHEYFQTIRSSFLKKCLDIVFRPINEPTFCGFAQLIPKITSLIGSPFPQYLKYIDNIREYVYYNTIIPNILFEYYTFMLQSPQNKERRIDINLEMIQVLRKLFFADSSISNATLFIDSILQLENTNDKIDIICGIIFACASKFTSKLLIRIISKNPNAIKSDLIKSRLKEMSYIGEI